MQTPDAGGRSPDTATDSAEDSSKAIAVGGQLLEAILDELREQRSAQGGRDPHTVFAAVVPQDGRQAIAAAQDFEFNLSNIGGLIKLDFDIPTEMDARLEFDGNPKLDVTDGQGRNGDFEFPLNAPIKVDEITLSGTNNAADPQDVGCWATSVV